MSFHGLTWTVAEPGPRVRAPRPRFAASVTLYGAALGAAYMLVAVFALTPWYIEAEHLPIRPALILSLFGALAAILMALPAAYKWDYWIGEGRGLVDWVLPGLGFGLILPFLTGAFLPAGLAFVALQEGIVGAGDLDMLLLDAGLQAPMTALTFGFMTVLVGLFTGAFLSIGGWAINRADRSTIIPVSSYGPWAIAISLGVVAVAIAAFAPAQILASAT